MKHPQLVVLACLALFFACQHEIVQPVNTGDNGNSTGGNDSTSGSSVCFTNEVLPVLIANCARSGCHNSSSRAEGYDFSSYLTTMRAVSAGNPDRSILYKVITATGGNRMPPSPYSSLSSDDIQLIYKWIEEGARNTTCTN